MENKPNFIKKFFKLENSITLTLIVVNVLVFICFSAMEKIIGGFYPFYMSGIMQTHLLVNPINIFRLLTSTFNHFSFQHIIFNMYSLYILGNITENILGKTRFLIIYIASGITGSAMSFVFHERIFSAGASGSIYGLMGVLLVVLAFNRNIVGLKEHLGIILLNLFLSIMIPHIDFYAHIGGFIAGAFLTYLAIKSKTIVKLILSTLIVLTLVFTPVISKMMDKNYRQVSFNYLTKALPFEKLYFEHGVITSMQCNEFPGRKASMDRFIYFLQKNKKRENIIFHIDFENNVCTERK